MNYADFVNQLARYSNLELVFQCGQVPVHQGYHVTEVLAHTVHAVDCGGAQDHWTETVLQLLDGHEGSLNSMRAGKAHDILQRSQLLVSLQGDSRVLLEFRSKGAAAAQRFHVTHVLPNGSGQLVVGSDGARTQCKAAERGRADGGDDVAARGCCAPQTTNSPPKTTVCCGPGMVTVPGQSKETGCCV